MFIAALLTRAKCLWMSEGINAMWSPSHKGIAFSLKGKEILTDAAAWMDLEDFMLKLKYKCCVNHSREGPRGVGSIETGSG